MKPNPTIVANFRSLVEQSRKTKSDVTFQDVNNALLFLKSQREHQARLFARICLPPHSPCSQILIERYNPLTSLTEEERIRKTANRVGLDVPKEAE
ncbi:hypothetical protein AN958_00825 [Leucoagaricus sp. SymC.cos]|nr:hypothetical protein AN958_00825 [Leucoagaricus sp. SymC.cos]